MNVAPYSSTDIPHRIEVVANQPVERLRVTATVQLYEIALLHDLIESMALGLSRAEMPESEGIMLDIILEGRS